MTEMSVQISQATSAADAFMNDLANDPCDHGQRAPASGTKPTEPRFRALMTEAAWASLPCDVRRRFETPVPPGGMKLYAGHVVSTELSRGGRALAFFARIAGSPLPDTHGATGPATVIVTEDSERGGQVWTRLLSRPGRDAQVITSVKRFAGPTGLEERLGRGFSMRLRLSAEDGALVFRSVGYDFELFGRRIRLPALLAPGTCEIVHRNLGSTRFSFTLTLTHPLLGRLVRQDAHFEETVRS
jgi:Domain of unknown function (DUF4166)